MAARSLHLGNPGHFLLGGGFRVCNPRVSTIRKKWRLYILPQYFANQTKHTGHAERYGLIGGNSYTNVIALVEFE